MSLINKHSLGLSPPPTALGLGAPDPALLAFFRHDVTTGAPAFSTIYAFGESLSDAGKAPRPSAF